LDRVYETDMAEGLKAMALEGHGVAFLPHSAVKKDLRAKKLVSALPTNSQDLQITMEVRAYRERPLGKDAQRNGAKAPKSAAQALWNYLATEGK
jgi:DNA-binding transcriptional LysR family regulator